MSAFSCSQTVSIIKDYVTAVGNIQQNFPGSHQTGTKRVVNVPVAMHRNPYGNNIWMIERTAAESSLTLD